MIIKQTAVLIIFSLILVFSVIPNVVKADNQLSSEERIELLFKIQNLLEEVLELQQRLEVISSTNTTRDPYKSKFFTFPYEAIYFVDDLKLVNSDGSKLVRSDDEKLFDLFVGVVGENEVDGLVSEWRIFYDGKIDTGAYVESINNMTSWIVGVNRENYQPNDRRNTESFVNLYIHEYLHILLTKYPSFKKNYKEKFWTEADIANQLAVEKVDIKDRFSYTSKYYNNNEDRFVSDYATVSVDEDLAETFVFFVRGEIPSGNSIEEQKIRYFYTEPDFVEERQRLRNNLKGLNVF
ncbi:MAG: hypothetical protein R3B60_00760 [Candidatus Paceibacterota bacterium]